MLASHARLIAKGVIFLVLTAAFIAIHFQLWRKSSKGTKFTVAFAALLVADLFCSAALSHIFTESFSSIWTVFEEPVGESDEKPDGKPDEEAAEKNSATSNSGPGHNIVPSTSGTEPGHNIVPSTPGTEPGHNIVPSTPGTEPDNNIMPAAGSDGHTLIDIESEPFSEDEIDIPDEPIPMAPVLDS